MGKFVDKAVGSEQPSRVQTLWIAIGFLKQRNLGTTANSSFANSSSFLFSSCWLALSTSWESTHYSSSCKICLFVCGCTITNDYCCHKTIFQVSSFDNNFLRLWKDLGLVILREIRRNRWFSSLDFERQKARHLFQKSKMHILNPNLYNGWSTDRFKSKIGSGYRQSQNLVLIVSNFVIAVRNDRQLHTSSICIERKLPSSSIAPIYSRMLNMSRTAGLFALLLPILLLQSISVNGLSNMAKVKHVVMFTLQDDVDEDKVKGEFHYWNESMYDWLLPFDFCA